ncbi:hypothetical protein [Pantoea sp. GD03673]|uniref:hypothetical protein n=1 Tax=Pantoea sp. GD03673 TaxID=2975364 RepID=UPI00244A5BD7|nr:hypothetical protein [Pantoea sp. GD03673]MDH2067443.1 type VI secretion system baseplate subunit TssF [Pantoea sp. GD03673]
MKLSDDIRHWRLQRWPSYRQRGVDIDVTLDTAHFAGEGDVWMCGSLLNRFSHTAVSLPVAAGRSAPAGENCLRP